MINKRKLYLKSPIKKPDIKFILMFLTLISSFVFTSCKNMMLFNTKGPIGEDQMNILVIASLLMLIVILPVFVMIIWFSLKYKSSKSSNDYQPEWSSSNTIEWFIWSIPILIVGILSYITITKTYELDPYTPIDHTKEEVKIEVVSMDWRWLFIYPEEGVASVNELVVPEKTPLNFRLTSASVMTSFFIPQLGSQMYAMSGMQTHLNLLASEKGEFRGQNQEFSGKGYKNMHFKVKSVSEDDYQKWLDNLKNSKEKLDWDRFSKLSIADTSRSVIYFSNPDKNLFENILQKNIGWDQKTGLLRQNSIPNQKISTMKKTSKNRKEAE